MGELAEMSVLDRKDTKVAAQRVLDSVVQDLGNPSKIIIGEAARIGIPVETMILWLAQMAVEAPDK